VVDGDVGGEALGKPGCLFPLGARGSWSGRLDWFGGGGGGGGGLGCGVVCGVGLVPGGENRVVLESKKKRGGDSRSSVRDSFIDLLVGDA